MSCYKPLIRLYSPDNKEISGRVYSLARFSQICGTQLKYEDLMYRKNVMLIPAGSASDAESDNERTGQHE